MKLLSCQIDAQNVLTREGMLTHQIRLEALIEAQLAEDDAELILMPELSAIEYSNEAFNNLNELATELDGPIVEAMANFASRINSTISFGMPRQDKGAYFISQVTVDPGGNLVGYYDKLHIAQFGASGEKPFFTAGNHVSVFEIGGLRFGTIICYDMRFGEFIGQMVRQHQLDVILHPVAFYQDGSFASWQHFVGARALENQVYFISTNRAGKGWGYSMFSPPWFEDETGIDRFGEDETCKVYALEKAAIKAARETYPLTMNRREDYEEIILSSS